MSDVKNKIALCTQVMETIGNMMEAHPVEFVETLMANEELVVMFESCAKSVRYTIDKKVELKRLFKELANDGD